MTVTELNAITDYVVEGVLAQKREEMKKSVSTITENELNVLLAKANELVKAKNDAKKALDEAEDNLKEFQRNLFEQNFEGRYVYVEGYFTSTATIRNYTDDNLFRNTKFEPCHLRSDVQRKLILKNLSSEVDVEKFIQDLVASY